MGGIIDRKQEEQKQTTQSSQVSFQGWGVNEKSIPISPSDKDKEKVQAKQQEQDFFTKEIQERKKQIEAWNKQSEIDKSNSKQQSEVKQPQNQNDDKKINHAKTMPDQSQELVNPLQDSNNPLYQSIPSLFIQNDEKRQNTEQTPVFNKQKVEIYDSKVEQINQFQDSQDDQQKDQNTKQFNINEQSISQSVYVNNDSQTQHQQIQENSIQSNTPMVESQPIKQEENQNKQPISFMPDSQKVQQPQTIQNSNDDETNKVFGTQIAGPSPNFQGQNQKFFNFPNDQIDCFGSKIEGESPRIVFDQLPYQDIKFLQIFNSLPKIIQEILQEKGLYQPKELKQNQKTAIKVLKQPDGSMYEGQLENNQRHGYGMFWYKNEFYEGYFEKNERNGWGRVINMNKELKSGFWQQNSIQKEMYLETENVIFTGQCRNNLPHGRGILERKGQFKYEGTFSDGKLSGQGIKRNFVDKTSYEGEFFNDVIQGYGTFKFSNGKRYQGQFQNNKFHGNGEIFWPDGRYYKGQFLNNFRHGQGYQRDSDGSTYEGGWRDDKKHGMGKEVANGIEIIGSWIEDVFQEQ